MKIARALDAKRGFKVVPKVSTKDSIQKEIGIYEQLKGIDGPAVDVRVVALVPVL